MTTKNDERDHVEWPHLLKKKRKKKETPPSTQRKIERELRIIAT